jgi:uncharacterized protein (TIGR02246 family)
MKRTPILAAAISLAACQSMPGSDAKAAVQAATAAWGLALASCNVDRIMALYDPRAVLWPTTSRSIASSPQEIRKYFEGVCTSSVGPKGSVTHQNVRLYGDTAVNSGTFTIDAMRDGKPTSIPLRFSFTYRLSGGQWLIVDHHSSLMPAAR